MEELRACAYDHIEACKSAYLSFGLDFIKDHHVRAKYIATLGSTVEKMLNEARGASSEELRQLVETAVKTRNDAMELSRTNLSSMGKAFSATLKEKGKSVTELLDHYSRKITGDTDIKFDDLTEDQAAEVYMKVIEASGRTNAWVDQLSKKLDKAGKVLVVVSIATTVIQVCYDEHPEVAGALAAAEYFGVAVLGQAADGCIACGAGIAGLGALPVLGLCCAARIGLAYGAKPHFRKAYDVFTQPVFTKHRNHSKKLVLEKNMIGFVQHNPRGLGGAAVGGMLGNAILQGGVLPMMGGVAFGGLAGHYADVKESQIRKLRDEADNHKQRASAAEEMLRQLRARMGFAGLAQFAPI
jgi:hypothetical protein